jgi:hypothetical protein
LLTVYYTSYLQTIPQTTDDTLSSLLWYYCTDDANPAVEISVINSTIYSSPRIYIRIYNLNNSNYKVYLITENASKVVIELTDDLAVYKEGKEIASAQFTPTGYGGFSEPFYHYCVNILSNIFISYTYED